MVPGQLVMGALKGGLFAALIAVAPVGVAAQERLPAAEFLDRVAGASVSFYNVHTGNIVGVERFVSRDAVIWQPRGRACVEGSVSVRDDMVCFQFPDLGDTEPACWAVFQRGADTVLVNQDRWRGQTHVLRFENRDPSC